MLEAPEWINRAWAQEGQRRSRLGEKNRLDHVPGPGEGVKLGGRDICPIGILKPAGKKQRKFAEEIKWTNHQRNKRYIPIVSQKGRVFGFMRQQTRDSGF